MPGRVRWAAQVVPSGQEHAWNAREAIRVTQEHTFVEPRAVGKIVRGYADEGNACRRRSVGVRIGRPVRLSGEHSVFPGAPVSGGPSEHLRIVTVHQARIGSDDVTVSLTLGITHTVAVPRFRAGEVVATV